MLFDPACLDCALPSCLFLATIHYSALNLVKMMVDGQQIPELTMEAIS